MILTTVNPVLPARMACEGRQYSKITNMGKERNGLESRGDDSLSSRREGAAGEGLRGLSVHSPHTGSGSVSEAS